jgi:hypothetical protein
VGRSEKSILHTFGESRPASTQSSSVRRSRPLKRGKRTVKTDVLKREKYLWKDGGEVDRGEITLGFARRVGSSRWGDNREDDHCRMFLVN